MLFLFLKGREVKLPCSNWNTCYVISSDFCRVRYVLSLGPMCRQWRVSFIHRAASLSPTPSLTPSSPPSLFNPTHGLYQLVFISCYSYILFTLRPSRRYGFATSQNRSFRCLYIYNSLSPSLRSAHPPCFLTFYSIPSRLQRRPSSAGLLDFLRWEFIKENKKVRKQEKTISTKNAIKKKRKKQ